MAGEEERKLDRIQGTRRSVEMDLSAGSTVLELHIEEQSGLLSSFGLKTLQFIFLFLFPCSILLQLLGDLLIKSAVNFMRKRK